MPHRFWGYKWVVVTVQPPFGVFVLVILLYSVKYIYIYISCYPDDWILLISDTDEEELSRLAEAAVSGHSVIQEGDISVTSSDSSVTWHPYSYLSKNLPLRIIAF